MIKNLPQEIPITNDGSAMVIGWTNKRSFIVQIKESSITTGQENATPIDLDAEEDDADKEYLSLWDWSKKNNVTIGEFEELQERLETYIDYDIDDNENTQLYNRQSPVHPFKNPG